MVKEIECKDAGYADCEFLIRDENEEELVEFVRQHSEQTHGASVDREAIEKLMKEA